MNIPDLVILHLSLIEGIGPGLINALIRTKRTELETVDFYALAHQDFQHIFGITAQQAELLVTGLQSKKLIERECSLLEHHGFSWMSLQDQAYPPLLKAIHCPPPILYIQGVLPQSDKMLAIVGSRKANRYSEHAIRMMVPHLIKRNWTIVSGGALGADAMAHAAALEDNGFTIAVLGSGLLRPNPPSNRRLFEKIIEKGGALLSTFPLETESFPTNFPARNRIISGLSRGVLVVQAAEKSGTRITADFALEQGREVFAIPGPIDDQLSVGCHALIQQGAKLVMHANDILQEFGEMELPQPYKPAIRDQRSIFENEGTEVPLALEDALKNSIVQACVRPCTIDELMALTSLNLQDMSSMLFDLQLSGFIEQNFAGKWQRV